MKEQTIKTRQPNTANTTSGANARRAVTRSAVGGGQRPAARGGAGRTRQERKSSSLDWRKIAANARAVMPVALKAFVVICFAAMLIFGYKAVAAASFFNLRRIDVEGTERASDENIRRRIKASVAGEGVWRADLNALSADLAKESWVRAAVVSRVLPSGVRVRITERTPQAVVRTSEGKMMWVDDEGVMLAAVTASDKMPEFILRGWNEGETATAKKENQPRVKAYRQMNKAWTDAGIADRVSEINVDDLRDVRAQLAGRDAGIEVRLGAENYGSRLREALNVLDDARRSPKGGANIRYIVALNDDRIIVGSNPSGAVN